MEDLWKHFNEAEEKILNKEESSEFCKECKQILCISEEGFLTCSNSQCSIIVTSMIDHTAEWRYYGIDDNHINDPSRCGLPINPLLKESSFGCTIISNGHLSYEMRKMQRYTKWQSMPYKEKSQHDEFQRITIMSQNSGIPKLIIDDAIKCHKKISEYELTYRGDNRDGILAAAIYVSCKINNYPRTAKEISKIFCLDTASATKGCKNIQLILGRLEKDLCPEEKTFLHKTTPLSFVERFCTKLQMKEEHISLIKFICIKIDRIGLLPENTPNSIAAGVIFFVSKLCGINISIVDIKLTSSISEVTIKKCSKKISQLQDQLVPSKFLR